MEIICHHSKKNPKKQQINRTSSPLAVIRENRLKKHIFLARNVTQQVFIIAQIYYINRIALFEGRVFLLFFFLLKKVRQYGLLDERYNTVLNYFNGNDHKVVVNILITRKTEEKNK